ncbi:hypothetical protein THAOC_02239 [Thalassiosira oceanica]|uniref:PDZ domain-containing protein n=1 Tax=Thalassiosira oceanica TaxID=159749 RepID=K0TMA0_THAOC|nr:hypothetical protein THAOC_02239 [Thalassiosira oceanica]|eukprot:EJK76021.1 hypothetical protein THAOC_02239 [Thalassiosira oceanica]
MRVGEETPGILDELNRRLGSGKGTAPNPGTAIQTETKDLSAMLASWKQNIQSLGSPRTSQSATAGVGINLALHEPSSPTSCVYVQDLAPEGSAAKGGLKSGDVIVRVDDTKFGLGEKYVPQDVAAHIKGPEGSSVTVVVNRDGVLKEFQLTRKPIAAIGALLVPQNLNKAEKASLPLPRNNPIRLSAATPAIRLSAETPEKKTNRIDEDPGCIVDQFCCTNKNTASLESLNLKVENTDGQDGMTSSAYECSDKVDDLLPHAQLKRLHSKSESIDAEEKTDDEDISSVVNSVGSNEWELISERSGSAIMVSLTGSLNGSHDYRSVSPSLLKNNFVLTESNGEELEHVILPTDTLQVGRGGSNALIRFIELTQ